jgi:hypothetical protein
METFIEYMKLHLLSLEQDSERIEAVMNQYTNFEDDAYRELEIEDISTNGQWIATSHLLSVAQDMIK